MLKTFAQDVITVDTFSKDDLIDLCDRAQKLKTSPQPELLKGKILASCFFEPSTRTRLSFESAMYRLGGSVIAFSDQETSSIKKGESLEDTMRMVDYYADIIVLRHPSEGASQFVADLIDTPVINAGDGANEHPTQTFLDLFSIRECQGHLENLSIGFIGDLKYGRTVHSLCRALVPFNTRMHFLSPPALELTKELCLELRERSVKFSFHQRLEEIMEKVDILYVTRTQKERLRNEKSESLVIAPELLSLAKPTMRILHPLPRNIEIPQTIDQTPFAYYFQQAQNGLYIRQALLATMIGGD